MSPKQRTNVIGWSLCALCVFYPAAFVPLFICSIILSIVSWKDEND